MVPKEKNRILSQTQPIEKGSGGLVSLLRGLCRQKASISKGIMQGAILACLALMLTLLPALGVSADSYEVGRNGSITVNLVSGGEALSDVMIDLYQVGTVDPASSGAPTFIMKEAFAGAGIDLAKIRTTQELMSAAYKLQAIVRGETTTGGDLMESDDFGTTDESGRHTFANLEQGVYLLVKYTEPAEADENGVVPERVIMRPVLVTVPTQHGTDFTYDINVSAKVSVTNQVGSLTVTKELFYSDLASMGFVPIMSASADFQVGLFYDPDGLAPVGKDAIRTIHIEGASSGSVTYTGLDAGVYYVLEILNGQPVPIGSVTLDQAGNEFACYVSVDGESGNAVDMDFSNQVTEMGANVDNIFYDLPDNYFLSGFIHLRKEVYRSGALVTDPVDDTFYAGIYHVEGDVLGGEETPFTTLELRQNDTVTVEVPLSGQPGDPPTLYHVYEMMRNADGELVPVDGGFNYFVDVTENGYVELAYSTQDDNAYNRRVVIRNTEPSPTPTPVPETPTPTPVPETPTPVPETPTPTPTPAVTTTPTPTPGVTGTPTPTPRVTTTPTPTPKPSTPPGNPSSPPPGNTVVITSPPGTTVIITTPPTPVNPVRTGDDTPIGLYAILLGLALAAVVLILIGLHRRGKKGKKE